MIIYKNLAFGLFRIGFGFNIFMHGFVRFFSYSKFVNETISMFSDSFFPRILISAFAHTIPCVEASVGLLILLGLFTLPALLVGVILMIFLMIGMCILQRWEIVSLQMNYMFFYTVLIFLFDLNIYSLDRILRRRVNDFQ